MEWKYTEDRKRILISPPKQTLRISGHRLSTVLGLNQYATPFMAWAEITKLVKVPFVENKYIIAGRTIEPKAIDYIRTKFPNVMSMEEYFGNNIEDYRYNNFKDDSKIFGGVFDFVCTRNDMKTINLVGEVKTTSKPQLFANNNVTPEYLLQGALYAKLKGLDKVLFVVCFLQDADYAHPEYFVPDDTNTKLIVKKLSELYFEINGEYLNVDECLQKAEEWWYQHVVEGISPEFDEELDKEYLDIIRKSKPSNDNKLEDICTQAINLVKEIKALKVTSGLDSKEKELKILETCIKEKMIEQNLYSCNGYELKESKKEKFNEKRFSEEQAKLYNKYVEEEISYKLTKKVEDE